MLHEHWVLQVFVTVLCLTFVVQCQQCTNIENSLPHSTFCYQYSRYWVTGAGDLSNIQVMDDSALKIFNSLNATLQTPSAVSGRNGTSLSNNCITSMRQYACYTAYPKCILATYYSAFSLKPCPNICSNVDSGCGYSLSTTNGLVCKGDTSDRSTCNSLAFSLDGGVSLVVAILLAVVSLVC